MRQREEMLKVREKIMAEMEEEVIKNQAELMTLVRKREDKMRE